MRKPASRAELLAAKEKVDHEQNLAVIEPMGKPDSIPHDVWIVVQENGRLATERLNEILNSRQFMRLRAGDQAKLIKLAQDRAYGAPQAQKETKNTGKFFDMTAEEMNKLSKRAALPEYRGAPERKKGLEDE